MSQGWINIPRAKKILREGPYSPMNKKLFWEGREHLLIPGGCKMRYHPSTKEVELWGYAQDNSDIRMYCNI